MARQAASAGDGLESTAARAHRVLAGVGWAARAPATLVAIRAWATEAAGGMRLRAEAAESNGQWATRLGALARGADTGRRFLLASGAGGGRAVEVFGDLGRARYVAVLVPGATNDLSSFDQTTADRAAALQRAALTVTSSEVAVVAWLGYDAPGLTGVASARAAESGSPELRDFVESLPVQRSATVTVIGHSYGSLVTGLAARDGLRADNIVLLGSPGVGAATRSAMGAPGARVYAASAPGDWASLTERFGPDPASRRFGAVRLATNGAGPHVGGHSAYFTVGSTSLRNIALVTVGRHASVRVHRDRGIDGNDLIDAVGRSYGPIPPIR